jgi:hypothetical protein
MEIPSILLTAGHAVLLADEGRWPLSGTYSKSRDEAQLLRRVPGEERQVACIPPKPEISKGSFWAATQRQFCILLVNSATLFIGLGVWLSGTRPAQHA